MQIPSFIVYLRKLKPIICLILIKHFILGAYEILTLIYEEWTQKKDNRNVNSGFELLGGIMFREYL